MTIAQYIVGALIILYIEVCFDSQREIVYHVDRGRPIQRARRLALLTGVRRMKPGDCQLMTLKEIAALLRVSTRTVRRLMQRREMPAPCGTVGARLRWREREVKTWIEGGLK